MNGEVASVLDRAFPDRDVVDASPAGISWNESNRTVRVEFVDAEAIYLKVALDGDGSRIARERAAIAYAGTNGGVRVPEVVASDPGWTVPHLATAPVAGRSLVAAWSDWDREGRTDAARRFGSVLANLHALRFEEHGHIVGGGESGLTLETAPWTDVLVETIREARTLAPCDRFDRHFDDVIAAVEANRERLNEAPAALLHGDPAMPNCFIADGPVRSLADGASAESPVADQSVGFLDWELSHVGDPVRDLHRARDQQFDSLRAPGPDWLVDAFHDGYRERAGGLPDGFDERRPIYKAIRLLGVSGYFERTADYVDEPREELVDWLEAELERRLDAIR